MHPEGRGGDGERLEALGNCPLVARGGRPEKRLTDERRRPLAVATVETGAALVQKRVGRRLIVAVSPGELEARRVELLRSCVVTGVERDEAEVVERLGDAPRVVRGSPEPEALLQESFSPFQIAFFGCDEPEVREGGSRPRGVRLGAPECQRVPERPRRRSQVSPDVREAADAVQCTGARFPVRGRRARNRP